MEKREGCSASKLLGLRESKGLRIWLIVATFLSIIANFIVVIGCMSPATLPLHLYRVDRPALASALSNISHLNLTELDSPELPDSWYWGMSGVCAVYKAEDSTHCWRSFPPTTGLDELVEMSLKSHLGNASDTNDTQPVLSAWKEASSISNINSSKKRTHFIALSKGSATLAILSLLVGIGLFCISVASMTERFKEKPKLWILYLISILDGSMFLGSGIMSILAIKSSFCSILFSPKAESLNTGLLDGPGIDVLFGGVFLKFAAVGILLVGFLIVVFLSLMFAVACCAACCGGERRYYIDADTHHELVEV